MGIVVGGERAWRVYRKGDVAVALHWINGEPAMVLFPVHQTGTRRAVPFVIPLAVLHEYVRSDGHPHYMRALQGATEAARCLQLAPEMSVLHRIIDAIVEAAPDLVAMPPEPVDLERERTQAGPVVGELTIKDGERTVVEHVVHEGEVNHGTR